MSEEYTYEMPKVQKYSVYCQCVKCEESFIYYIDSTCESCKLKDKKPIAETTEYFLKGIKKSLDDMVDLVSKFKINDEG